MNLLYILIGFALGFAAKIGADWYHNFKSQEEKRSQELEEILTKFKAFEMFKKNN